MCISPILKRDIRRGENTLVPCGKCFECVRRKKLDWEIRLSRAAGAADCAFFCLLSFDEQHLPANPFDHSNNHLLLKRFFAKLRNRLKRWYGEQIKLKYYAATEYGEEKNRLHFHVLFYIFGRKFTWLEFASILHDYEIYDRVEYRTYHTRIITSKFDLSAQVRDKYRKLKPRYKVKTPCWEHGFIGNVYEIKYNKSRMRYTLKYIQKQYNKSFFSRFSFKDIISEEDKNDILLSWSPDDVNTLPSCSYNGSRVPIPYYWTTLLFDVNTRYEIRRHSNIIRDSEDINAWVLKSKEKLLRQCNFENTLN